MNVRARLSLDALVHNRHGVRGSVAIVSSVCSGVIWLASSQPIARLVGEPRGRPAPTAPTHPPRCPPLQHRSVLCHCGRSHHGGRPRPAPPDRRQSVTASTPIFYGFDIFSDVRRRMACQRTLIKNEPGQMLELAVCAGTPSQAPPIHPRVVQPVNPVLHRNDVLACSRWTPWMFCFSIRPRTAPLSAGNPVRRSDIPVVGWAANAACWAIPSCLASEDRRTRGTPCGRSINS
jgi:hypothetical protein